MEIRLSLAARRLSLGEERISEIACSCGFASLPHFSRVFKRGSASAHGSTGQICKTKHAEHAARLSAFSAYPVQCANHLERGVPGSCLLRSKRTRSAEMVP